MDDALRLPPRRLMDRQNPNVQRLRTLFVGAVAAVFVLTVACEAQRQPKEDREQKEIRRAQQKGASGSSDDRGSESSGPRRIIVMVGDGMGAAAVSGAAYTSSEPLEMLAMPEFQFLTTHSHEFVTTDSAASATAFATGEKTHYEGVSVEPGTTRAQESNPEYQLRTVLERAESRGWKTGLVSTVRIVHATPAAYGAHRAHRKSYEPIAADLVDSGVDVLVGGGRKYFTDRSDGRNLLDELTNSGFERADRPGEFRSATGVADRLVALLHRGDAPSVRSGEREVGLAERLRGAISVLDRDNDSGFFLMVEAAQVDWRGHGLDGRGMIQSTRHFDRAVGAAREYVQSRDDALLVVAADHETGGLSIMDASQRNRLREVIGGKEEIDRMTAYRRAEDPPEDVPTVMPALEPGSEESGSEESGSEESGSEAVVPVFGHLSIASRRFAPDPSEFWSIHTPEFVPMFAEGRAAEYVAEAGDNAAVGRRLEALIEGERSTSAETGTERGPSSQREPPENLVLFVGDGVGLDAWTAAHYGAGGLNVRRTEHQGLAATAGEESLVPGEGEAAAALARAPGGAGESAQSLLARAEANGFRTGIVTTGDLTNSTAAAFYAGDPSDRTPSKIASSFVGMSARVDGADGVDLAYGGGREAFADDLSERLKGRGVDVGESWRAGGDTGRRVVRLLADGPLPPVDLRKTDGRAASLPTLGEMTRAALDRLASWPEPFVLVVEADGPGALQRRAVRSGRVVDAVDEFDEAIGEALEFADRDRRTLVVATADADQTLSVFDNHYGFADGACGVADRCGGPMKLKPIDVAVGEIPAAEGFAEASMQGEYAPPQMFLQYAWPVQVAANRGGRGMNSANFVPVFASGPWSNRLEGAVESEEIGRLMHRAIRAD